MSDESHDRPGLIATLRNLPSRFIEKVRGWRRFALENMAPPDKATEDGVRVGYSRGKKALMVLGTVAVLAMWATIAYVLIPGIIH